MQFALTLIYLVFTYLNQYFQHAANKFINVAKEFHSLQYEQPALELLGHHEYNDQLMELERAFLLPSFASQSYQKGKYLSILIRAL